MQLTRLSIRNFRALEAVDVVLDPATVIVGANDSGKSTLLAPLSGQPGGAGKALRLPPGIRRIHGAGQSLESKFT